MVTINSTGSGTFKVMDGDLQTASIKWRHHNTCVNKKFFRVTMTDGRIMCFKKPSDVEEFFGTKLFPIRRRS